MEVSFLNELLFTLFLAQVDTVAANPRFGWRGGLYMCSCSAGLGLQWAEASNQPLLLRKKPKLCKC